MPYDVASPWAAAAGAMGGYLDAKSKKKQQDVENQQKAQEDADAQANAAATLGLTRSRDAATDAARAQTNQIAQSRLDIERGTAATAAARADADAAKQAEADKKQKLLEAFQGQGLHYPKNYATMKPEEKIAYLQVRLNAAQKAGDKTTVSNTETEINRVATEAAAAQRQADLEKQRGVQNQNTAQRLQITVDNKGGAGNRPLTRYQQIELDHWNKLHLNPDGSLKTNTKDTSGLSSIGNLQYQKDVRDWMMGGQDPATEPDPTSAKYPKKATGGGGDNPPGPKPVMHNGKPYYLHSDGNYYLTP